MMALILVIIAVILLALHLALPAAGVLLFGLVFYGGTK